MQYPSLSERLKSKSTALICLLLFLLICRAEAFAEDSISGKLSKVSLAYWKTKSEQMVKEQLWRRGIKDERVLDAMRALPRHEFVPAAYAFLAYEDSALPIGHSQTISQPYVVAFMTEALELKPSDRVLEIGTGSGYQAAVISKIVREVYSFEIIAPLARESSARLKRLGCGNVHVLTGDGYYGLPAAAPFDAIILTAACDKIPPPLIEQLKTGGRLVAPVGGFFQSLVCLSKTVGGTKDEILLPVRFVPMTGKSAEKSR